MKEIISQIKQSRTHLLGLLNELSLEQLNKIPAGFNNNIIWNLGHLVAAQQGVCYKRSELPLKVEENYFDKYKPGTKPEGDVTQAEVEQIKTLMFDTLVLLTEDYEKKSFTSFTPFTTRYGVELRSIEDAITFLLYHEGLHGGVITGLKRLVK